MSSLRKTTTVLQGDKANKEILKIAKSAGVKDAPEDALARLGRVLAKDGAAGLFENRELLKALAALSVDDPPAYAAQRITLRGAGVKMRDFDRALKRAVTQEIKERPPQLARGEQGGFFVSDGCICRTKLTPDGPLTVALSNFTATIVDETVRDDGAERQISLGVAGCLASGHPLPRVDVPAEAFRELGWVIPSWGSAAIVWPGENRALPAAIQALSKKKEQRTVYTHTGWRKIREKWYYLHGRGAIGPSGLVQGIAVSLPEPLTGYELPPVPGTKAVVEAVRASLGLLEGLVPDRIGFPLVGAVYRAVLGACDFSEHLAGPSGVFKSELAALCQQHYGATMTARNLPCSWSSTANALEGIAFAAKDGLAVVDDFAPTGSAADVQRFHRDADRLLRGQGNRSGRMRMRADATIRAAKPPRGLLLSTGEEVPRGQSLRARTLVVEVSPGDVNVERLTVCQKDARAGLYAQALASFVHWLARRYEKVQAGLREGVAGLREQVLADGAAGHARTPEIVANLALGLRYLLNFALDVKAITEAERKELWERGWQALGEAAGAQAEHLTVAEPTQHFLRLLAAALASGRANVADGPGGEPADAPQAWGWRRISGGGWEAQGRRIGWVEGNALYLEPEASFAEVQRLANEQGEPLTIGPRTLHKRLKEKGLLASWDRGRQRQTVRKTLEGTNRTVLHLSADALSLCPTVQTVQSTELYDKTLGNLVE